MDIKLESYFENKNLYELALTHKSWVNEHPRVRESNERLEFLGDAVLEFVVSKELYQRFPDKEEGYLTALRANLVNTINLSEVAKTLNLGAKLYLSKGEEETGGRENPSLLANTVEAIIGALFLDKGVNTLLSGIEEKLAKPLKDPKSLLQEYIQAKGEKAPQYEVVEEVGPDHEKWFTIKVTSNGKALAKGEGRSKSEAAQEAAKEALKNIAK